MKTAITTKRFNSVKYDKVTVSMYRERIDYVFKADKELTRDEAIQIQIAMGYHPQGYSFQLRYVGDGMTRWTCYTSCD